MNNECNCEMYNLHVYLLLGPYKIAVEILWIQRENHNLAIIKLRKYFPFYGTLLWMVCWKVSVVWNKIREVVVKCILDQGVSFCLDRLATTQRWLLRGINLIIQFTIALFFCNIDSTRELHWDVY